MIVDVRRRTLDRLSPDLLVRMTGEFAGSRKIWWGLESLRLVARARSQIHCKDQLVG